MVSAQLCAKSVNSMTVDLDTTSRSSVMQLTTFTQKKGNGYKYDNQG